MAVGAKPEPVPAPQADAVAVKEGRTVETQRMDAARRVHEAIRPALSWRKLSVESTRYRPCHRDKFGLVQAGDSYVLVGGDLRTEQQAMEVPSLERGALTPRGGQDPGLGWRCLRGRMPVAVHSHATVTFGHMVAVFGGVVRGQLSSETYVFDPGKGEWFHPHPGTPGQLNVQGMQPCPRKFPAACRLDRRLLVHGGWTDEKEPMSPSSPKVPLSKGAAMVGQRDSKTNTLEDLWVADVGHRSIVWRLANGKPVGRYGHTLVPWDDRIVCFGGSTHNGLTNSLCLLSMKETTGTWLELDNEGPKGAVPKARQHHCTVISGDYMVIYGGQDELGGLLQDTHALHLPSMTWTKPLLESKPESVPPARAHAGAATYGRHEVLVFGGVTQGPQSDAVYCLQLGLPSGKVEAQVFHDMLGSLLDRSQRGVEQVSGQASHRLMETEAQLRAAQAQLQDAETVAMGLHEQMRQLRLQAETFEQAYQQQLDVVAQLQHNTDGAKKQASESVSRTEMELQRLQAKVKRLLGGGQASANALLPSEDVQLFVDEGGPADQTLPTSPWTSFRCCPGKWKHAEVSVDLLEVDLSQGPWEESLLAELRVCMQLRHPSLTEPYGALLFRPEGGASAVAVLMEPLLNVDGVAVPTTLLDCLGDEIADDDKIAVALEVANCLEYLHARGVVHGNLALDSLFMRDSEQFSVKVGRLLSSRTTCRATRLACLPTKFAPPDAQDKESEKADPRKLDIYALGVLLCSLYIQERPSDTSRVSQIDRIRSKHMQMVVMACLDKDADHRPSALMVVHALLAIQNGEMPQIRRLEVDPSATCPLIEMDLED